LPFFPSLAQLSQLQATLPSLVCPEAFSPSFAQLSQLQAFSRSLACPDAFFPFSSHPVSFFQDPTRPLPLATL